MKRFLILVEEQTEERFIKNVLYHHLWKYDIDITPIILTTKRIKCGPDFKGGVSSYQKVKREMKRLLGDSNATIVTTMLDLYALPSDFPGRIDASGLPREKARYIEDAFTRDINDRRFKAHLSLYEYEGMLFSEPPQIARTLNEPSKSNDLQRIRDSFPTPEDINDNPKTAPSKQILNHLPTYTKGFHGALIAQRIGLQTIRNECPHFDEWVIILENL